MQQEKSQQKGTISTFPSLNNLHKLGNSKDKRKTEIGYPQRNSNTKAMEKS